MKQKKEVNQSLTCKRHNMKMVNLNIDEPKQDAIICPMCHQEKQKNPEQQIKKNQAEKIANSEKANGQKPISIRIQRYKNREIQHTSSVKQQPRQLIQKQSTEKDVVNNEPKKVKKIYSISGANFLQPIAFDKSNCLMFAGNQTNIKIWKFSNGKLLKKLSGNVGYVICIVFSKKQNWFVSSSFDMILGWKKKGNDWISSQAEKKIQNINNLILNNDENELISSSCSYPPMVIWNVDCQNNTITYKYTLIFFTEGVNCIILNESETALVSFQKTKKEVSYIILWMKGQDKEWEYTSLIKADWADDICFISDTEIFFQPWVNSQTQILKIENNSIFMSKNLINLKVQFGRFIPFQTIFNKQRQLIIARYDEFVCIIQSSTDGGFKIVLELINCLHKWNYCTLTEDGEGFVTWNCMTRQLKVHQIFY